VSVSFEPPGVHGDATTPPTRPPITWGQVEALAAILEPEAADRAYGVGLVDLCETET
jgi:hypothetical protein